MGRSPERRAPDTAGGTRARQAGRSREIRFCREGAGIVRERGSATAGAAWAGSTHSEQSSGCARVVRYEARETRYSNQVYTLGASLSRTIPGAPYVLLCGAGLRGTVGIRFCTDMAFRILSVIQVRTTLGCRPLSI